MLSLQGGANLLVKDPSGLLLPPNEDAARWLSSYYQNGNRKKYFSSSPSPHYPTPDGEESSALPAKISNYQAREMLARTSGYLLESEKELIKKIKQQADSAPHAFSSPSSSSTWWQRLVYKTSNKTDAASLELDMESVLRSIPEVVLTKLEQQHATDFEDGNFLKNGGTATTSSTVDDESISCGGEEYLEYELATNGDTADVLEKEIKNHRDGKMKINRRNVLVAPVGDDWSASVWMDRPNAASFDIIALYFGDNATYACPLCAAVVHLKGPKWRLFLEFSESTLWSTLSSQYDYIMLPDDDLHMNTCSINKVFSTMRLYDLLMAQPSVCHARGSATWRPELHQIPTYLLRYTTFVEVMAPTFRMDFYQSVICATFSKYWTYVGWGLDSIWPALVHYPQDRIAVIDAVCMRHVPTQGGLGTNGKKSSVYAPGLSPYTAKQEELIVFSAFNYSASTTRELGEKFMSLRVLGAVPNFYVLEAMAKTAGQKWPSLEFAGEYGIATEMVEPLLVRNREAKVALAALDHQAVKTANFSSKALEEEESAVTKSSSSKLGNDDNANSIGNGQIVRARAWVWLVPAVVLAMLTTRAVMVSSSSRGQRGWRRVGSQQDSHFLKR